MNIERELNLIDFFYQLKANPQKAIELATKYYTQFLSQQDQIKSLEQNCRDLERGCEELEIEKANIYAELEMLRISLEQEQNKDNSDCDLHLSLPSFLPANPHNYLIP